MSEGRNIEIKIAATGADRSAGEIGKVEDAMGRGGKGLNPTINDFNKEGQKVSATGLNMRSTFSNVGYQVQDFAVQVGGGTSAVRAFSQQAPQLLSAFGPWGIGLGTVVALGAPLVGQLFQQAEGAKKVSSAFSEATEKTIELGTAQKDTEAAEASHTERLQILGERLRQITTEEYGYVEALRQSLQLLKEKNEASNTIAKARGEADLESAGDDPVKKEEVRNRLRKEAQEREQQQIEEESKAKKELIARIAEQQDKTVEGGRNAAKILREEADAASREALQAEQSKALAEGRRKYYQDDQESGSPHFSARTSDKEIAAAERDIAEAEKRANEARSKEGDLRTGANDAEKSTQQISDKLQEEMQKLFTEMRQSANRYETNKEVFTLRDQSGDLREQRAREAARKKAEAEAEKEAAAEARRSNQTRTAHRDLETDIVGLGKDAADATRGIGAKGINPEGFNTLAKKIAKKGDRSGDVASLEAMLSKLGALVDAIPDSQSGGVDAQKLRDVESKLEKKLNTLQSQIRNMRGQ